MSELDNIIRQTISLVAARVTQAGFGTPLVLDYHTRYSSNLVRTYEELADMTSDTFAITDPAYVASSKIASQDNGPTQWKVGRRTHAPSQIMEWTPATAINTLYAFGLAITGGTDQLVSFTSSATANSAEILTGIKNALAALNGYGPAGLTAATASGLVRLTGPASGPKFEAFMYNDLTKYTPGNFTLVQDKTADNNIAADLAAIIAEDDDFYGIMTTSKGIDEIKALAAAVQSLKKVAIVATMDNDVVSALTTDVASYLNGQTTTRTAVIFNDRHMQHPDAALLGAWLPKTPGSENVKFIQLSAITPTKLTPTYRTNLRAKNANFFNLVSGANIVEDGVMPSGEFMDTIRYDDWVYANIAQDVYAALIAAAQSPGKIAINTDAGLQQIGGVILNVLTRGEQNGGGVKGSSVVNVPAASSIPPGDRVLRYASGFTWSQDLAGAVNAVGIAGKLVE